MDPAIRIIKIACIASILLLAVAQMIYLLRHPCNSYIDFYQNTFVRVWLGLIYLLTAAGLILFTVNLFFH